MENIKLLFKELENLKWPATLTDLEDTVKNAAGIEQELIDTADFSNDYYTRNLVYSCSQFDALVVTWKSRQRSPLHNHKGSACVVRVLKGTATEISYARSPSGMLFPVGSCQFCEGDVISSFDEDIHQMTNLENGDLVTLHVYAPGLKAMEIFSLTDTCLERYDELVSRSFSTKTQQKQIQL